jgi:WXG100 family type VII secretion target
MSDVSYALDTDSMDNFVQVLATASASIDERLGQLQSRITAIFGDHWLGPAHDAYLEQKQNWDNAAVAMNELLVQASGTLSAVTQGYVDTEQTAMKRWMNL